MCCTLPQTTGLTSASSESQPSSSDAKTQLTDFSQIPQILRARFRCMTSFTSPGQISIWDFYFDISEWHILPARAWTPVLMLHLTNPCAKRKVLSLTKPKGKIYKTKSLGHYIILFWVALRSAVFDLDTDLTWYASALGFFLRTLGGHPSRLLPPYGGGRFIAWHLRRPSEGECRRRRRHFLAMPDACVVNMDHFKKPWNFWYIFTTK